MKIILPFILFSTFVSASPEFCRQSRSWSARALEAVENKGFVRLAERGRRVLYRGCHDVTWMKEARAAICDKSGDISSVTIPDKFIFLFDGFAGFNPAEGLRFGASNISGFEEKDFGIGYATGLQHFMEPFGQAANPDETHQLQYHSTSGFMTRENLTSAFACAGQIKQYLDVIETVRPLPKKPKWIALGFSNGGDRALIFQKKMARDKNVSMDLVITVDPVAQWGSFLFNELKKTIGEKHPDTRRLVNFYQTMDRHSFPVLGLNGKPVRKADENIHVTAENLPALAGDRYPHAGLMKSDFISGAIACEIRKLDYPDSPACDYSSLR